MGSYGISYPSPEFVDLARWDAPLGRFRLWNLVVCGRIRLFDWVAYFGGQNEFLRRRWRAAHRRANRSLRWVPRWSGGLVWGCLLSLSLWQKMLDSGYLRFDEDGDDSMLPYETELLCYVASVKTEGVALKFCV